MRLVNHVTILSIFMIVEFFWFCLWHAYNIFVFFFWSQNVKLAQSQLAQKRSIDYPFMIWDVHILKVNTCVTFWKWAICILDLKKIHFGNRKKEMQYWQKLRFHRHIWICWSGQMCWTMPFLFGMMANLGQ